MEQRTEPQKTRRKETTLICLDFEKFRENRIINIDINCRNVSFTPIIFMILRE